MTSLAEALSELPKPKCAYQIWYSSLSESDAASVDAAMSNPEWSLTQLHKIFREHGLRVTRDRVTAHRKQQCNVCFAK